MRHLHFRLHFAFRFMMQSVFIWAAYGDYGFAADAFDDLSLQLSDIEGLDLIETEKGQLELVGKLVRPSDARIVQNLLKRYPSLKNKVENLPKNVSIAKIVVEISLVEVRKSAFQSLGIDAPDSIGFEPTSFSLDRWKFADPVRGFLDMAVQKGEAQIHAKQSLVASEGQSATFHVGGEFPIRVSSGHYARVEFKDFGLHLGFIASKIQAGSVTLKLNSDMSEIDMGAQVDGIPVITKKKLETVLSMKLNEMTAIGGVFRSSQAKSTQGIPFLQDIPGLGRLFQSEDFRKAKSEAYLFLLVRRMDQPWMPTPDL